MVGYCSRGRFAWFDKCVVVQLVVFVGQFNVIVEFVVAGVLGERVRGPEADHKSIQGRIPEPVILVTM